MTTSSLPLQLERALSITSFEIKSTQSGSDDSLELESRLQTVSPATMVLPSEVVVGAESTTTSTIGGDQKADEDLRETQSAITTSGSSSEEAIGNSMVNGSVVETSSFPSSNIHARNTEGLTDDLLPPGGARSEVSASPVGLSTASTTISTSKANADTREVSSASPSPQNQSQNNLKKGIVCHPSKLYREHSQAISQPFSLSRSSSRELNDKMAPNVHVDSDLRVNADSTSVEASSKIINLQSNGLSNDETIRNHNRHDSETDESRFEVRSFQEPPAVQSLPAVINQRLSYASDAMDIPPVMMAPAPGTMLIQQPNGTIVQTLQPQSSFGYVVQGGIPTQVMHQNPIPSQIMAQPHQGRRKIKLRLQEDVPFTRQRSFFFRRKSVSLLSDGLGSIAEQQQETVDRGVVSVSWFEGTSSTELQEHVRKTVIRKMGLDKNVTLEDMRIIDETTDPPEEIVLSPYIPDGSDFLLKFVKKDRNNNNTTSFVSAPESPSAAPSPRESEYRKLNAKLLAQKLNGLNAPQMPSLRPDDGKTTVSQSQRRLSLLNGKKESDENKKEMNGSEKDTSSKSQEENQDDEVMSYHPEDQIEVRLKQLADLMIADRRKSRTRHVKEKRQVIFVLANYFVLFLSLIIISAEIQSRAPKWVDWVEMQLENVQKCSTDQEALFECVSKGDVSGLIATFILWVSRSAATKRFFLFGFESPKKLWTVVYESLVTAFCWGTSYILIRRGMNPDTRSNFLRKYWKDAVYGSLAGFNASFMKQVLKNLIPQEALEDALQERQLKILSWLPNFH